MYRSDSLSAGDESVAKEDLLPGWFCIVGLSVTHAIALKPVDNASI